MDAVLQPRLWSTCAVTGEGEQKYALVLRGFESPHGEGQVNPKPSIPLMEEKLEQQNGEEETFQKYRHTETKQSRYTDGPCSGRNLFRTGGGGWRGQGKFLEFSRMSPSNTQTRPRHTTCFKCPVASCELLGCRRGSSKRMVPPTPQLYHARLFAQGAKCENDKRHWVQWGWFLQKK